MNAVTKYYKELTILTKQMGWKVRHYKRFPRDRMGEMRQANKEIAIGSTYKNTKMGCFILGHEMGHMVDYLDRKYKKFYYPKILPITDKRLIENVEWSATLFSKKLMKMYGFDISGPLKYVFNKKCFRADILPECIAAYSKQTEWPYLE